MTSTGCPVSVQMSQLRNLPGLSSVWSLFQNHLVRMPVRDGGDPVHRGRAADDDGRCPAGTARHSEVGRLTGKLHVVTIEPLRAAEEPPK